jgi:hypothetical protein
MNIVERYTNSIHNIIKHIIGLTYDTPRERPPVFVSGSPDPRSFSRGKRGVTGTIRVRGLSINQTNTLIETLKGPDNNITVFIDNDQFRCNNSHRTPGAVTLLGLEILNEEACEFFTFVAKGISIPKGDECNECCRALFRKTK